MFPHFDTQISATLMADPGIHIILAILYYKFHFGILFVLWSLIYDEWFLHSEILA